MPGLETGGALKDRFRNGILLRSNMVNDATTKVRNATALAQSWAVEAFWGLLGRECCDWRSQKKYSRHMSPTHGTILDSLRWSVSE